MQGDIEKATKLLMRLTGSEFRHLINNVRVKRDTRTQERIGRICDRFIDLDIDIVFRDNIVCILVPFDLTIELNNGLVDIYYGDQRIMHMSIGGCVYQFPHLGQAQVHLEFLKKLTSINLDSIYANCVYNVTEKCPIIIIAQEVRNIMSDEFRSSPYYTRFTMLCIHRFRPNSVVAMLPKDLLKEFLIKYVE